jgi:hypothetical protein
MTGDSDHEPDTRVKTPTTMDCNHEPEISVAAGAVAIRGLMSDLRISYRGCA